MKKILISILLLLTLLPALKAQQLEEHLATAGENSPLLKAHYAEYQAALQRVPQVGSLPDPEANFSFFLRPMERYMGNQLGDVSVMQMFPWFGSLGAAKDEAKFMAQMKFSSFIEAKINLYHEVRSTWYTLYRIDKEEQLVEKELEIMQALERISLAKYKSPPTAGAASGGTPQRAGAATGTTGGGSAGAGMAGMGSSSSAPATQGSSPGMSSGSAMSSMGGTSGGTMVDVILIKVQVKELENRLHVLRQSRRPLEVQFNNLLHRQPDLPVAVTDTLGATALPASLALLQDSIREHHPMLQMYSWDEKARASQLRMAQLMGRPMIGIGLNYMVFQPRQDAMMGEMSGGNMLMPMVSISLPIYRKKYNAQQKEAEYAQQAASYQKEYTERQLFTELENLLYEYQRTNSTLQLLQDQVALNEQAIRLLTTNYTVAATGLEEVLRQRQNLLSYKQQQLQAVVDQHIAVSAIRRLMSSDE
ncbi:TolC family protein [Pontibacter qinzhouensis]|uniref:TolC family protein n=1 Tax=Pontibacter qinzhouensis TaxID=2603253 RepID=A0A5C8JJH9_9BACT|nr:TolC family protein [Pontibacter qinzhouensis]TXK37889.1 TolC family protein [Pontibacter qinzhouensis]